MFKVWPSRRVYVLGFLGSECSFLTFFFFLNKRDQDSTRRNKDAISRLSPCENSFGTDTRRPTVLEHFIIVALMLYDGQAAGKCLHFTDPYPIPDFPVPPSFVPLVSAGSDMLPSGHMWWGVWAAGQCRTDCCERRFDLMHLTSVETFHPSPCQKFWLDQSWGRTHGSSTNEILSGSFRRNDTSSSYLLRLIEHFYQNILNRTNRKQ